MRAVAFFALSSFASVASAESWLCKPEITTGLAYDKDTKQWVERSFATDHEYVIRRSKTKGAAWEVVTVGEDEAMSWCEDDFDEAGLLSCSGLQKIDFHRAQLKFTLVRTYTYFLSTDRAKKPDPLVVSVGRCTTL